MNMKKFALSAFILILALSVIAPVSSRRQPAELRKGKTTNVNIGRAGVSSPRASSPAQYGWHAPTQRFWSSKPPEVQIPLARRAPEQVQRGESHFPGCSIRLLFAEAV